MNALKSALFIQNIIIRPAEFSIKQFLKTIKQEELSTI